MMSAGLTLGQLCEIYSTRHWTGDLMLQLTPLAFVQQQLTNYYFSIRDSFPVWEYEECMVCIGIKANYTSNCFVLHAESKPLYVATSARSTGVRICLTEFPSYVNILIALYLVGWKRHALCSSATVYSSELEKLPSTRTNLLPQVTSVQPRLLNLLEENLNFMSLGMTPPIAVTVFLSISFLVPTSWLSVGSDAFFYFITIHINIFNYHISIISF